MPVLFTIFTSFPDSFPSFSSFFLSGFASSLLVVKGTNITDFIVDSTSWLFLFLPLQFRLLRPVLTILFVVCSSPFCEIVFSFFLYQLYLFTSFLVALWRAVVLAFLNISLHSLEVQYFS